MQNKSATAHRTLSSDQAASQSNAEETKSVDNETPKEGNIKNEEKNDPLEEDEEDLLNEDLNSSDHEHEHNDDARENVDENL